MSNTQPQVKLEPASNGDPQSDGPTYSPYFVQTTPRKSRKAPGTPSPKKAPSTPSPVKTPQKRGRKPKTEGLDDGPSPSKVEKPSPTKERRKVDRFKGMPEEEVAKRFLPDHLAQDLDIVIIGINPGLYAAFKGHHYAGPGNHFWKCMFLSGLIPNPMTSDDDFRLLDYKIGFTNMVDRTTRGSADLSKKEIQEGGVNLLKKIQTFKPKIAVFNGKCIYEIFSGNKKFFFGKQPDKIKDTNTVIFVMPSSSARCSMLPRATDKVPFYLGLKKLRDHLNGHLPDLKDSEVIFEKVTLKAEPKEEVHDDGTIKTEDYNLPEAQPNPMVFDNLLPYQSGQQVRIKTEKPDYFEENVVPYQLNNVAEGIAGVSLGHL